MTLDITTGRQSLSAEERNGLYDKVVTPHYDTIAQAVRRQTFPGEDADDNLQEVLIHLLQNACTIAALPPAQQLPWMLRAIHNKLTSIHRHERHLASIYCDDNDDDARSYDDDTRGYDNDARCYDDISGHCSTPSLIIDREDYPRTYDTLMALPALQRRAILLEAEGWTPTDIMAELRLPATTVYPLLSRARKAVAHAYSHPINKKRQGNVGGNYL